MKKFWHYLTTGLAIVVGLLLYLLKNKSNQLASYQTKLALIVTQKEADFLEIEIVQKLKEEKLLIKERQDFEDLLVELNNRRKELPGNKVDFEDYWNN